MDNNKVFGLLGMSRRAGRLSAGFDAVCADVMAGKAAIILLASDTSQKTCKQIRFIVAKHAPTLPLCFLEADKQALAHALGFEKPIGVCCINDTGFADALQKAGVHPECCYKEEEARL